MNVNLDAAKKTVSFNAKIPPMSKQTIGLICIGGSAFLFVIGVGLYLNQN